MGSGRTMRIWGAALASTVTWAVSSAVADLLSVTFRPTVASAVKLVSQVTSPLASGTRSAQTAVPSTVQVAFRLSMGSSGSPTVPLRVNTCPSSTVAPSVGLSIVAFGSELWTLSPLPLSVQPRARMARRVRWRISHSGSGTGACMLKASGPGAVEWTHCGSSGGEHHPPRG